ncbi:MAG: hypothetical protein KDD19_19320 [Phaeodactylibacter sp.]|nr:hypothetical protein [Phaeodactylibacter sp.]MCB9048759.1 hypothetical protein [Lewinellaceae bacterium]
MEKHMKTLSLTIFLLLCATVTHAALRVSGQAEGGKEEKSEQLVSSVERTATPETAAWAGRKWEKLKQRIERKQAKWEKRKANRKASRGDGDEGGSLWASLAFILGIIFLAVGIILGIAAFSNPLGGFFHLLAGLLVITGIILILYTALHSSGA